MSGMKGNSNFVDNSWPHLSKGVMMVNCFISYSMCVWAAKWCDGSTFQYKKACYKEKVAYL